MDKLKCCVPSCRKRIPQGRLKNNYITCSKTCVMTWAHMSSKSREKIRGEKYNRGIKKDSENAEIAKEVTK